ncbi:VOC family protein [uncultured Kordia sp.]|uniref:VOC family protein n=1 Tax=uncultured Kordia sp. TaxID=507699 RepID=UPI002638DA1D|nr:VOC family protein [uncultured Kordia sp.]
MRLNLLVIRTPNPAVLKDQYEKLGFQFEYHQHGNGPFHYASEQNGFVFEIYPLTKSQQKADNSTRLGFDVANLEAKIKMLESSTWKILSKPKETAWGLTALVQDLDGRKVELKHKN